MANRRMFSREITGSDSFLDMPSSTQCLYFQLGMHADDDGFLSSAKRISRMLGCGDDDLRILIAKKFVIMFETGICVITHWKVNNQIRKDRHKETMHLEEKAKLMTGGNDVYELPNKAWQPNGNQMATKGQPSIGEVSIVQVSTVEDIKGQRGSSKKMTNEQFEEFWELYPRKLKKGDAKKKYMKLEEDHDKIILGVKTMVAYHKDKEEKGERVEDYPHPTTWINNERREDEYDIKIIVTEEDAKQAAYDQEDFTIYKDFLKQEYGDERIEKKGKEYQDWKSHINKKHYI